MLTEYSNKNFATGVNKTNSEGEKSKDVSECRLQTCHKKSNIIQNTVGTQIQSITLSFFTLFLHFSKNVGNIYSFRRGKFHISCAETIQCAMCFINLSILLSSAFFTQSYLITYCIFIANSHNCV